MLSAPVEEGEHGEDPAVALALREAQLVEDGADVLDHRALGQMQLPHDPAVLAFIVRLYERQNAFTWQEVCAELHAKMVRRHPHVFGHATARSEEELQRQWAEIKAAEKRGQAGGS